MSNVKNLYDEQCTNGIGPLEAQPLIYMKQYLRSLCPVLLSPGSGHLWTQIRKTLGARLVKTGDCNKSVRNKEETSKPIAGRLPGGSFQSGSLLAAGPSTPSAERAERVRGTCVAA